MVELRRRTVGEMVGMSFSISADMFGRLFLILILTNLPYVVVQALLMPDPNQPMADPEEFLAMIMQAMSVSLGLSVVFVPIMEAAIIGVTAAAFEGRTLSVGRAFLTAFRRYWGMLALLLTLGIVQGLGFLAFIVPGFILSAMFYVAGPALIVEKIGWLEALQRSRALTQGRLLETLAVLLSTRFLVPMLVSPFVLIPAFALAEYQVASLLLQTLITLMMTLMGLVAPVITYYHLRVVKEAYDVEQLAGLVAVVGQLGEAEAA